jgi:hypothetical protein
LTLIFFGIAVMNLRDILQQKKDFQIEKVLDEWYYIANDVWIQGNGSSYIWRGSLPEDYVPSSSTIMGNSIVLVYEGNLQYVKTFSDFTIDGTMPSNNSGIVMNISNDGTKVSFNPIS